MDEPRTTSEQDARYGSRLKQLREDAGLTQTDVVRKMRQRGIEYMNASTLSRIENGSRAIRLTEARALARIFRVSIEGMVGEIEWLALVEAHHRTARELLVRFRKSVVDVTEAQLRLAHLRELRDTGLLDEGVDPNNIQAVSMLWELIDSYLAIDLAAEAADLASSKRESWEANSASSAGRFLNNRPTGDIGEVVRRVILEPIDTASEHPWVENAHVREAGQ
ncbi:MAG: XRE family transcriptional regulator [Microbacteriaceae bacterium]|nr:MAG: XRE family transcriptional regulator [Microbacteriaceae bacterium]